ncbi:MAG: hypothetical protein J5971_01010 [Prevotella sp.]|nr:hypothetical protein [Prevotella sp.]
MEPKTISLVARHRRIDMRNQWETLTREEYIELCADLCDMQRGKLSDVDVRTRLAARMIGADPQRIKDEEALATLVSLGNRLTFLFKQADDGRSVLDLCFCAQLLPVVYLNRKPCKGYRIDAAYGQISTSLTALQYIDASHLAASDKPSLPLLASILYSRQPYDSGEACRNARLFEELPHHILQGIEWNFQAFNNFIFTRTPFSLLAKFETKKGASITTDAADALYDLAHDGFGNTQAVEQMNLFTYLRILRKKTIDTVRQMRQLKMDTPTISNETGLPIEVINDMI